MRSLRILIGLTALATLLGASCQCKKHIKYQQAGIRVTGLKVPVATGKTVELAETTIDPKYRDVSQRLEELDLTQWQICTVLHSMNDGPEKEAAKQQYLKTLLDMYELASRPERGLPPSPIAAATPSPVPALEPTPRPAAPISAEARGNLDWAIGNTGAPDCVDQYLTTYPTCLTEGNRSCLMRKAIDSARAGDCANAFRLSLITQCHNSGAQASLGAAGQEGVCGYLRTK